MMFCAGSEERYSKSDKPWIPRTGRLDVHSWACLLPTPQIHHFLDTVDVIN